MEASNRLHLESIDPVYPFAPSLPGKKDFGDKVFHRCNTTSAPSILPMHHSQIDAIPVFALMPPFDHSRYDCWLQLDLISPSLCVLSARLTSSPIPPFHRLCSQPGPSRRPTATANPGIDGQSEIAALAHCTYTYTSPPARLRTWNAKVSTPVAGSVFDPI
jgi:hypothetical protein